MIDLGTVYVYRRATLRWRWDATPRKGWHGGGYALTKQRAKKRAERYLRRAAREADSRENYRLVGGSNG